MMTASMILYIIQPVMWGPLPESDTTVSSDGKVKLLSDCADTQTDLNILCTQMPTSVVVESLFIVAASVYGICVWFLFCFSVLTEI